MSDQRPDVITQLLAVDDTGTVANYIRRLETRSEGVAGNVEQMPAIAAALLMELKKECEQQHARAEQAEQKIKGWHACGAVIMEHVTGRADEPLSDSDVIGAFDVLRCRAEQAEQERDRLRDSLAAVVRMYDAYRRCGVQPAPVQYQHVVDAINAARGLVQGTQP